MAHKGAKSRTRAPSRRSTRTKARTHVDRVRESRAELERKLAEALEQQAATAEVLQVISSSPGELEPVFEAMLANATRLCEAKFGSLYLREGDAFRAVAFHNAPPALVEERKRASTHFGPNTGFGLASRTKQVVHIADAAASLGYLERDPFSLTGVEAGPCILSMPKPIRTISSP